MLARTPAACSRTHTHTHHVAQALGDARALPPSRLSARDPGGQLSQGRADAQPAAVRARGSAGAPSTWSSRSCRAPSRQHPPHPRTAAAGAPFPSPMILWTLCVACSPCAVRAGAGVASPRPSAHARRVFDRAALMSLAMHPPPRSAGSKDGYAIHVFTASASMGDTCLANADGDFLIVPQLVRRRGLRSTRARVGASALPLTPTTTAAAAAAASGRAADHHRVWAAARGARGDLRGAARHAVQVCRTCCSIALPHARWRRCMHTRPSPPAPPTAWRCRTVGHEGTCSRCLARTFSCQTWGSSAPTAWPARAIF